MAGRQTSKLSANPMPYTKSSYDIFLSYRHLDNQKLTTEQDGWVFRLHKDIAARVCQYLGREVSMWRDPRLQGNDYFGDAIEQTLLDVATDFNYHSGLSEIRLVPS